MAEENTLKYTNDLKIINHTNVKLNINNIKEILTENEINFHDVISNNEKEWLTRIDCVSHNVLQQKGFELTGKVNDQRYFLEFQSFHFKFPENHPEEKEENIVASNILSESSYFQEENIKIKKDNIESELPVNKVVSKTICVKGVPSDVNLSQLALFFENKRRCGGGKIEGKPYWDANTNSVEITFADDKVAKNVLERSPLTYKDLQLHITLKQPLRLSHSVEKKEINNENILNADDRIILVRDLPENLQKEKIKLYFENKKRSNGGKILNLVHDRKNNIIIKFESAQVAKDVLKKEHTIAKHRVTVVPYIPPLMQEKKAWVRDINEDVDEDTLMDYLEPKADSDIKKMTKIKSGVWLVDFEDKIDILNLQKTCENESLKFISDTYPKVEPVEVTKKIELTEFPPYMKIDDLKKCLNHSPISWQMLPGRKCIFTFENSDVALEESKNKIKLFKTKLYDDYSEGKETFIEIRLNSKFWLLFLKDQKSICEDELKDYGYPDWSESHKDSLKIIFTDDIEETIIKQTFNQFLEMVFYEQVLIPSSIFDEIKNKFLKDNDACNIYFDDENFEVHIFSFNKSKAKNKIKNLHKLIETMSNVQIEEEYETYKITLIVDDLYPSKISKEHKNMKFTHNDTKIVLKGLSSDIETVQKKIYKYLSSISSIPISLPQNAYRILQEKTVKEYLKKQLKSKKCICSLEIKSDQQVLLHSSKNTKLQTAIDVVKQSISELKFDLTPQIKEIMKEEKWKTFDQDLSKDYSGKYFMECQDFQLSVVTIEPVIQEMGDKFEKFFDTNVVYTNSFTLKNGVYHYLKKFEQKTIEEFGQKHEKIKISFEDDQTIQISGPRKSKNEASKFLQKLIDDIKEKKESFTHLGFDKFLNSEFSDTMFEKIMRDSECVILKKEDNNEKNILSKPFLQKSNQITYGKSEILLKKEDITELNVDAIVHADSNKLQHIGPFGRLFIEKGGSIIQKECDDYVASKSTNLKEGCVFVTTAGNLICKYLIHAVCPIWENGQKYEMESLAECITNSLCEAEKKSLQSIAFPAIGTGIFRFPLDKSTEAIISIVKDYIDDKPDTSLKRIYLVSNRENGYNSFLKMMKAQFANFVENQSKNDDYPKPPIPLKPQITQPKQEPQQKAAPLEQKTSSSLSSFSSLQNRIEIIQGLLNKTKCNVIVNTTNNSLDLSSGAISKALLAEAGRSLQDECYQKSGLRLYDIAVTNGYNLPCDKVFHLSLPHWSQSSIDIIKSYVKNCLIKTDELNFSHIAFPAFGTGNLNYPIQVVVNGMYQAASDYLLNTNSKVQKITFVIFPTDKAIYQAFQNVQSGSPGAVIDLTDRSDDSMTSATRMESDDEMTQDDNNTFDIGGIKLIVESGNLLEQRVDAIIHGTNRNFNLNGAIHKFLLQKIGPNFTADCKLKSGEMSKNDYAITSGHSLPASNILHINIENIKNKANDIFKRCFDAAEKEKICTLAMPLLGSGGMGCNVQYLIDNILSALHELAKSSPQNLKSVKLVIFNNHELREICTKIAAKEKPGLLSRTKSYLRSFWSSVSAKKPESYVPFEVIPPTCHLFFYAKKEETIQAIKMEIDSKYKEKYLISKQIKEEIIGKLTPDKKRKIAELQSSNAVRIQFHETQISIDGYKDDVGTVVESINLLLISFTKDTYLSMRAENTQKFVQWSYMTDKNGKPILVPYPIDINQKLEDAYGDKKILKLKVNDQLVVFDLTDSENMKEYPENNKKNSIKIFRKDKSNIALPENWSEMGDQNYLSVELKPGYEYNEVKKAFPGNFTIVKIERIQNKSLYIQYQAQLTKMNELYPKGNKNEIQGLWHGTSKESSVKINQNGFNRSYCGKNATAYGKGVYYAKDPQYSLSNTYSPPNAQRHKHIYMCNVLVGMICQGSNDLNVLPENPQYPTIPFDCAVNDLNNPTIFVVFHDANAYPAYLITCM